MTPTAPMMAAAPPAPTTPLRRLPGSSPSVRRRDGARAKLWLGDTQLVQELTRGYTVEVQRYALADLHAVQIRRTPRGMIYNVVLLVLLLPMGLQLVSVFNEGGAFFGDHAFFWGSLGLVAALLVVNVARGPTCRTTVLTVFGSQELPSLSRVRTARRALSQIAANVAAVQGALPPDEAAQAVDRARSQAAAATAPPTAATFPGYQY